MNPAKKCQFCSAIFFNREEIVRTRPGDEGKDVLLCCWKGKTGTGMGEGTGKALDCAAAELGRRYRVSKREKHLVGDLVREGEDKRGA